MREPDALDDAVARADLFRSRQAAFGAARAPRSAAVRRQRGAAMAGGPRGAASATCRCPTPLRSSATTPAGSCAPTPPFTAWQAPPMTPTCSECAFHRFFTGPDRDARLLRTDGNTVGVGVVRFGPLGGELAVVALVERGEPGSTEGRVDRTWAAELERLARVGTGASTWPPACSPGATRWRSSTATSGSTPTTAAGAASSAGRPTRCARRWRRARRARRPRRAAPARRRAARPAGPRSSGRPTAPRCASSASCATSSEAQRQAQRFADLMTVMPGGVAVLDPAGRIVSANPGLCALLGARAEQLRGMAGALGRALAAEPPMGGLPSWLRPVPPGAQYGYRVDAAPLLRADGTTVWCELDVAGTHAEDGSTQWLVVVTDVSERRRVAELLRRAGTIDELTRLPNRAACLELLDRLLAGPGRDRVAVVCGGLDDFQRINSSLGHDAGDDLLVTLAGRLQRDLPVTLHGRAPVRRRVRGDLRRPRRGGRPRPAREPGRRPAPHRDHRARQAGGHDGVGRPGHPGAHRRRPRRRPAALRRGRDARRQAQAAPGRHRGGHRRRRELGRPARWSWRRSCRPRSRPTGSCCEYQPVVGPDGRVLSLEALVRWPHPERGLIPPGEFLPVAQRSGLLRELDRWVLRTAARRGRRLARARAAAAPAVAVNLAGLLPGDVDFAAEVRDAVARRRASRGTGWCSSWSRPAWSRSRRTRWPRWRASPSRASGSRSTTSAPATPRWPGSRSCPRRPSRWTARSSPGSPTTPWTSPWRGRWWTWRTRWAAARWPRASRPPSSSTCCAASASTPTRAGCSPARWRPSRCARCSRPAAWRPPRRRA